VKFLTVQVYSTLLQLHIVKFLTVQVYSTLLQFPVSQDQIFSPETRHIPAFAKIDLTLFCIEVGCTVCDFCGNLFIYSSEQGLKLHPRRKELRLLIIILRFWPSSRTWNVNIYFFRRLVLLCLPALWRNLRVYIFHSVRKSKLSLRLHFPTARQIWDGGY